MRLLALVYLEDTCWQQTQAQGAGKLFFQLFGARLFGRIVSREN